MQKFAYTKIRRLRKKIQSKDGLASMKNCLEYKFGFVLFIIQDKKKRYEPPIPTRVGKKAKKNRGPAAANKLPQGKIFQFRGYSGPCYTSVVELFLGK